MVPTITKIINIMYYKNLNFQENQQNQTRYENQFKYDFIANQIMNDRNLEPRLRIFLRIIYRLSKKKGYCSGGNNYLAKCVANDYKNVSKRTITRWVKQLSDAGIIRCDYSDDGFEREITILDSYLDYLKESNSRSIRVKKSVKTITDEEETKSNPVLPKETTSISSDKEDKKPIQTKNNNNSIDPVETFLKNLEPENLRYYNCMKKWLEHKQANKHTFSNVPNVRYEFLRLISIVKDYNIDADFLVDYNIKHGYLKLFKPDKNPDKFENDNSGDFPNNFTEDKMTDKFFEDEDFTDISENADFDDYSPANENEDEELREMVKFFLSKPIHSREDFERVLMTLPTFSAKEADELIVQKAENVENNQLPEPIDSEDVMTYGSREEEIITKFKNLIYKNFGKEVYAAWFDGLIFSIEDDNILLSLDNEFVLDCIKKEYYQDKSYREKGMIPGLITLAKKAVAFTDKMFKTNRRIDENELSEDDITNAKIDVVFRHRKPKTCQ